MFYVPESKEKRWDVVIVTKPRDLFEMEDQSVPKVDLLEAHNSTMVDGDDIRDVRDDIPGVTFNESFANVDGEDNDVEVLNSYHSEGDEEDETWYDFDSQ